MFRNCLSIVLTASLIHAFLLPLLATPQVERKARQTAKAKADVARLRVGKKASTSVKLRAGAVVFRVSLTGDGGAETRVMLQTGLELKGYISQAAEDSFTITDVPTTRVQRSHTKM